jgi:hypothetical protein
MICFYLRKTVCEAYAEDLGDTLYEYERWGKKSLENLMKTKKILHIILTSG